MGCGQSSETTDWPGSCQARGPSARRALGPMTNAVSLLLNQNKCWDLSIAPIGASAEMGVSGIGRARGRVVTSQRRAETGARFPL